MKKCETILSAVFFGLLAAAYGIWAFQITALSVASAAASAVICVLFGWCGLRCIQLVCHFWNGEPEPVHGANLGRRSLRPSVRHPVLGMCLAILLSRLAVYVLAYAILSWQQGYQGGFIDTIGLWLKGDAPHYMGLAENWYVTQGDARFHIVFFPLYPILVRLLQPLLQSYFASGLFVSNLAAVAAGYALYELALLDMDRACAKRAVKYQFLLPAAFLLCAPMSDSLFLLLSILCLYALRKNHILIACLLGGLSAFCRMQGVLLLAPVLVELIGMLLRQRKQGSCGKAFVWKQIRRFSCLMLIPAGVLLYLWINYQVTGNPLQFMIYQKEHWSQSLSWFFNTAAYQTDLLLEKAVAEPSVALGLWVPNLLFLFGGLAVVLPALIPPENARQAPTGEAGSACTPHLRASYAVYYLVYYFFSMGATWLLSAPRYLTCAAPLALALALNTKRRWVNSLFTILLFVLQVLYLAAYVAGWPVY